MDPEGGTKVVDSQNWLRKKGTHKDVGLGCALVLVWIREILQGEGQWKVAFKTPDDVENPTTRWTPHGMEGGVKGKTRDRHGTKIGTYLGGTSRAMSIPKSGTSAQSGMNDR